jgi:hypothetical protein
MSDSGLKTVLPNESGHGLPRLEGLLVAAMLIVGLYCPTSTQGSPSKILLGFNYVLGAGLVSLFMLKRRDLPSIPARLASLAIIPLLLVFTAIFGLREQSFGELASFLMMALLWMLNLRSVRFGNWLYPLFSAINIANIVLGVAVLAGNSAVAGFLTKFYTQFDDEMVSGMMLMRKPVLTFATHSLAGFFYYLFFHANFQTFKIRGGKLFLILAFCYLLLMASLLSVTGVLLSALGLAQIGIYFLRRLPHPRLILIGVTAAILFVAGAGSLDPAIRQGSDIASVGRNILMSQQNGFLGRLSPTGTMYPALQYIREHPFSPLGVSRSDNLLVADMGFLDYFIRGSIFLVVWAYGGLFLFLKRSLLVRWDLWFLFGVILGFELGFSVLGYTRMLFLLPFFVIYLNELRRHEKTEPIMKSAKAA